MATAPPPLPRSAGCSRWAATGPRRPQGPLGELRAGAGPSPADHAFLGPQERGGRPPAHPSRARRLPPSLSHSPCVDFAAVLWCLLLHSPELVDWGGLQAGQAPMACDSDCLHAGREARNIEHLGFSHNIEHLCFCRIGARTAETRRVTPCSAEASHLPQRCPGRTSRWSNPAGGRAARGRASAARRAAEGAPSELLGAAPGAAGARSRLGAVTCCQEPFWMPFARKK